MSTTDLTASSQAARGVLARLAVSLPGIPKSAVARYQTLRRDVSMLRDALAGRAPRPFLVRTGVAEAEKVTTALTPRSVRVKSVTRETADAVSLTLEDPSGAPIPFAPGQFFTLLLMIEGTPLRRAYSASSSALDPSTVTVTIKRVASGMVSNFVNDQIHEGASLQILGPSGSFTPAPEAGARHLVLVAGGSGITPMMAIARTLLASEPDTRITLVYGNRGRADIIFHDAIEGLSLAHRGRFTVRHVLSDLPQGFEGGRGMLDRETTARELDTLGLEESVETEYFLCGPEPMMAAAKEALLARNVPAARIHEERFASPHLRAGVREDFQAQLVTLRLKDRTKELTVSAGQTILEAGLDAGVPLGFSCAMGGCGVCKVKLVSGEVEMEEPNCLTPEEVAGGCVLACVARPRSSVIVESIVG